MEVYSATRDSAALNFLPVRSWMPADATLGSLDSLYCGTSRVFDTMNSSTKPLTGSCRMLLVPYRAALLRLQGRPDHLVSGVYCNACIECML